MSEQQIDTEEIEFGAEASGEQETTSDTVQADSLPPAQGVSIDGDDESSVTAEADEKYDTEPDPAKPGRGELPELIKMQFLGVPNVVDHYRSGTYRCKISDPDSCLIDVPPQEVKRLLTKFPEQWRMRYDAATAKHLGKLLKNKTFGPLVNGASVQAIKGAAKIIQADGTEIVLPAGSRVTVERGG
ncbi:hypothetical protein [Marinobacter antarcticus]|uniref:Uncharacterized protein n=1 Tax=Marinobacter antarcticus TaxID=564117 RepID=A0A831R5F2_9GAMM|nr:hypothetical protein [Marinobacter antarcticus]HEA52311.1 hypothetical protein [Marinobacter antarcticus]